MSTSTNVASTTQSNNNDTNPTVRALGKNIIGIANVAVNAIGAVFSSADAATTSLQIWAEDQGDSVKLNSGMGRNTTILTKSRAVLEAAQAAGNLVSQEQFLATFNESAEKYSIELTPSLIDGLHDIISTLPTEEEVKITRANRNKPKVAFKLS